MPLQAAPLISKTIAIETHAPVVHIL